MESARVTVVRNRASGGTERRMWCKNAVLQFGRLGWRSAHDRLAMEGCAGPVIGEMDLTDAGRVFGSLGCRIGETNALDVLLANDGNPISTGAGLGLRTYGQRRLEIDASESTICSFSGQVMPLGSDSGRLAM